MCGCANVVISGLRHMHSFEYPGRGCIVGLKYVVFNCVGSLYCFVILCASHAVYSFCFFYLDEICIGLNFDLVVKIKF